ncbi:helix-turn-helix domain-containing protein [Wansuia hejianensis]|uniref:Helix-turn-helix transcriptional regulator n=1 Tax=Wansuia hejianensis TaxID=2763667 RepID=A0A926ILW8_9FIRM|nr:helix-turn-helix transcriptional regulator [Wansuia hejianensis]MBC8590594.1 helix-turn-helix transcriptional regulator [Wansuia hejianensis]
MNYPENTLGDKIRKIRNLRGLTAKQLGALCNCSADRIYCYESNKATPRINFINAITNELNISIDYFENDYFNFVLSDKYTKILYNWRKKNTTNRFELEKKLGVTYYNYLKWEKGKKMSMESFNKIKNKLNIKKDL